MGDYAQEMKSIWDRVANLPEGQDKVVMEQLWQLSQDTSPDPKDYPAIFEHGFLIEEKLNGGRRLRPFSPSLNEFSRKYIGVSPESGYRLKTFTESDTPEEPKHNSLNRHSSKPNSSGAQPLKYPYFKKAASPKGDRLFR